MRKLCRRALALALTAAMALSLAACGGKKEQQGDNKETLAPDGFVWVPKYIELDSEQSYYGVVASDEYIYYSSYDYDEKTETSSVAIASVSIEDGSAGPEIVIPQEEKQEEGMRGNRDISGFMLDTEGNLLTIEGTFSWNEKTQESKRGYYICRYSAQGEKLSEQDITEIITKDEENSYIQYAALDGENRLYIVCSSVIHLFNAEGNYDGNIKLDGGGYAQNIGVGKDGKMYLAMYSMTGPGMNLSEIDYAGKKLGQSYSGFASNGSGNISQGLAKDFLGTDGTSIYDYDMKTQSLEKILDWLDCDVNGNNVNFVKALADGRLMAITNNWESNSSELILLTKKPASEVPQKQNLVLGALYLDNNLSNSIVNFNKNNEKYHVSVKKYYDNNAVTGENYEEVINDALTRMNNDITSDNCPDLLCIDNIDVARYAAKGVFEDLGGYLDRSSKVKRADFFENILDAYTYDGVLVAIPKNFEMESMVGKASDLGEKSGWTLAEMIAYGEAHPDAELWGNATKEQALSMMLRFTQGNFVDWTTGACSFDSEEFEQILELANTFPKEWQYDESAPSLPKRLQAGEVLLDNVSLYDFESIQVTAAMFGSDVNYIGYPNENGESGTYFQGSTGVALTSKCTDKDAAWSFLEQWLSEEKGERSYSFGFPSKKSEFAKERAEATKVEYVLDENGEKVLDENGEPMVQSSGGMGYGDWEYDYRPTTEEEADFLEELIGRAKPAASSDAQIMNIVNEEAQAFFSGQRSAKDVAGVIQSRVQVYVNENS